MSATARAFRTSIPPPLVDVASRCGATVRFVFAGECVRVSCASTTATHCTKQPSLVSSQQRIGNASVPAMRQFGTLSFVLRRYHVAQLLAALEPLPSLAGQDAATRDPRVCHMKDPFFDLQCTVSRDAHARTSECTIAGVVWDETNRPVHIGRQEGAAPSSGSAATQSPWTFEGADLVEMETFLKSSMVEGFGFVRAR